MYRNRTLNLLPLAVLAVVVLAAFTPVSPADDVEPLEIGAVAPMTDAPLVSTDGDTLTLAEAAGENGLVVMFTCNTCPWVEAWEDRYPVAANAAEELGLGFIALNPNEKLRDGGGESMAAMKERAEAKGYNFPYVVDADHKLADAFGATRTPEIFLFDSDMTLVYHGAIDDDARNPEAVENHYLMDAMKAMVDGETIAEPTTRSVGCTIKRLS
jgi:peroxiredoxin